MNNMKSPENDGFTTEFYNFFWINVKQILIMSFYESYSEQKILLAKHMFEHIHRSTFSRGIDLYLAG
jgi:hypothetical protein